MTLKLTVLCIVICIGLCILLVQVENSHTWIVRKFQSYIVAREGNFEGNSSRQKDVTGAHKDVTSARNDVTTAFKDVTSAHEDGTTTRNATYVNDEPSQRIDLICDQSMRRQNPPRGIFYKNKALFYCNIPKCGTTFMGVYMKRLFDCEKCAFKVKDSSPATQETIDSAFSFMFVREPYSRLFSAYENKLFHPNDFWNTLGRAIIKEVRPNASEISKRLGHDVTFVELVKYVVTLHEQGKEINAHLREMYKLCNPCSTHYDYIGRLESMTEDLEHLAGHWKDKHIQFNYSVSVQTLESETKQIRSLGRIRHLYRTRATIGSSTDISPYDLFKRTWSSYRIRGMILHQIEMPFNEKDAGSISEGTFTKAIVSAMRSSDDKAALAVQRREALMQAYRSVPMDLLFKLRDIFKTDCHLFGYDNTPDFVFKRNLKFNNSVDYFCGLI